MQTEMPEMIPASAGCSRALAIVSDTGKFVTGEQVNPSDSISLAIVRPLARKLETIQLALFLRECSKCLKEASDAVRTQDLDSVDDQSFKELSKNVETCAAKTLEICEAMQEAGSSRSILFRRAYTDLMEAKENFEDFLETLLLSLNNEFRVWVDECVKEIRGGPVTIDRGGAVHTDH